MSDVPYYKRRRLAARAKRIINRRAPVSPPIKAYELTFVPRIDDFINAYDTAAKAETAWRKEMNEGRGAVAILITQIQSWTPILKGSIPGLKPSAISAKASVPDDVIAHGEKILSAADTFKDNFGQPLPYLADLKATLGVALADAQKEWAEAEASDKDYQALLAVVRATGDAFNDELLRFRRTLAAVAGRSDKDYQKLRAERVSQVDEEDDPHDVPQLKLTQPTAAPASCA